MNEYVNLEPNHVLMPVEYGLAVMCPFEIVDGEVMAYDIPLTQTAIWAKDADPSEVECPVCEVFKGKLHYVGSPDCADATD